VSERLKEPVSKTGVLFIEYRGFESRPLRCVAYFGVYLKKSELILRTIGSAGGIPPEPPFRPPRFEAEAKRTISSFSRAVARKENHK
jgi:hypothetical protein